MKTKGRARSILALALSALLAAWAAAPVWAAENPFTDVPEGEWYYPAVMYCWENQLFKGTSDTTFAPDDHMTRAMFVTVLGRYEGVEEDQYLEPTGFTDVVAAEWYGPYVKWASENGIVKGYDAYTFGTNDEISREQMVTMFYRYAVYKGVAAAVEGEPAQNFGDYADASSFSREALNWAVSRELIHGTPKGLEPLGYSLRAQVAQVFYNIYQNDILRADAPQTVFEDPQAILRREVAEEVPSYLVDNTVRVINAINQDADQEGTDAFLFFTDIHVWYNTWSSAKVMDAVFRHTGVRKLICGGDIPCGWETSAADCVSAYTENYWPHISAILPADARHYMVHGNHDYFYTDPYSGYTYLSAADVHRYVMQAGPDQESYVNSVPDKNYYTFFSDDAQVEYIVLDTVYGKGTYAIEGDQIDWLIDQLSAVPAGYSVLVIGHIPADPAMVSHDTSRSNLDVIQTVLEAYENRQSATIHIWDKGGYLHDRAVDFSQAGGALIGFLSGHEHGDNYRTDGGVNGICVCADVPYTDVLVGEKLERTVGTQSECAVDVCVIHTQSRTMDLYRIGAGSDLHIEY